MKTVLVCGAGKSSTLLIDYLLQHAKQNWHVIVMDGNADAVAEKLNNHPKGSAAIIDVTNDIEREALVAKADIVLSILPPFLHVLIAKDCLKHKKHLITSSYISPEIRAMDAAAKEAGLMFMCEMGLDPGIDHMSAMSMINSIHKIAGEIKSFKSFCGGLVAPESDDNPWHYKISWNPRNIVLAGSAGAEWLENGKQCHLDYENIYKNSKKIKVDEIGSLAYYPNRDSMEYLDLYDLKGIKTFMRATLRYPNFMKYWEVVIRMQLTSLTDSYDTTTGMTYGEWLAKATHKSNTENLSSYIALKFDADEKTIQALEWLGIFDTNTKIRKQGTNLTSADIIQDLLEDKWILRPEDKDLVVMVHQIEYERKDTLFKVSSSLVVKGENRLRSSMAKTVGLPMAILAKRVLLEGLPSKDVIGVHIPVMPEVYTPVLKELTKYGVEFVEKID